MSALLLAVRCQHSRQLVIKKRPWNLDRYRREGRGGYVYVYVYIYTHTYIYIYIYIDIHLFLPHARRGWGEWPISEGRYGKWPIPEGRGGEWPLSQSSHE